MAFSWPDISRNQLMQAGLGLLGSGFGRGQTNPFMAAGQGLAYGQQMDLMQEQRDQQKAEQERRARLDAAWSGMFAPPGTPPAGPQGAPQMADASGNQTGMGQPTNPALARYTPQQLSFLQAMGPEKGAAMLWEGMNKPRDRVQDAEGYWRYTDTGERVFPGAKQQPKLTDDQREYAAAKEEGFEGSFLDYMTTLRKAGANSNTITVGGGDKFGEEWAKATVGRLTELEGKAQDAVSTLQANQEARGILDQGIISGAGADWRLNAAKLAAQAGFDVDTDPIAATEAYFANRSKAVAAMAKNFGSGAGITEADREFAERAAGGQVEMTEKSLRRILEIGDKAAKAQVKAYNDYAANVRKQRPEEGKFIMDVQAPEFPAPKQYNVPPPAERGIGTFYDTPKGRAMWTGEGWQLEKDVPGGR